MKNFRSEFLEEKTVKSGKEKGKTYVVVQRTMKPLKAPGMEHIYHYVEYEQRDIDIMKPGRTFNVSQARDDLRYGFRALTPVTLTYDSKRKASLSDEYVEEGGFLVKRIKVIDLTNE